ncbi:MAG: GAF domain-containing protein [Bacteroidia bacterium]|jgi:GAF domain-containing protein
MEFKIAPDNSINLSKQERYENMLQALTGLIEEETDLIAGLANTSALLREYFGWWWIGFYIVRDNELVLGPFQGPVACTRIGFGKGVCGTAWKQKESIIVPNVHEFPGHIACSAASNSEIVIPILVGNEVRAVLDADSVDLAAFDAVDAEYLNKTADLLSRLF